MMYNNNTEHDTSFQKLMSSKSKIKSALAGTRPGNPFGPYARIAGTLILARSPMVKRATARSNPGITASAPTLNRSGRPRSREESNFVPSVRNAQ